MSEMTAVTDDAVAVPETAPEPSPAPPADVINVTVLLPVAAVQALIDTGYLAPAERTDEVAIARALVGYMSAAWLRGFRKKGEPLFDPEADARQSFLNKLAAVNS